VSRAPQQTQRPSRPGDSGEIVQGVDAEQRRKIGRKRRKGGREGVALVSMEKITGRTKRLAQELRGNEEGSRGRAGQLLHGSNAAAISHEPQARPSPKLQSACLCCTFGRRQRRQTGNLEGRAERFPWGWKPSQSLSIRIFRAKDRPLGEGNRKKGRSTIS